MTFLGSFWQYCWAGAILGTFSDKSRPRIHIWQDISGLTRQTAHFKSNSDEIRHLLSRTKPMILSAELTDLSGLSVYGSSMVPGASLWIFLKVSRLIIVRTAPPSQKYSINELLKMATPWILIALADFCCALTWKICDWLLPLWFVCCCWLWLPFWYLGDAGPLFEFVWEFRRGVWLLRST